MTPETSYFPRACDINLMMSYESVVLKIVEFALNRSELYINLDLQRSKLSESQILHRSEPPAYLEM
jgi:hypothetical protein